ncbi:MAG: phosphopyruvate hydratase [Gammaproteobacteria bacterium]|nr:phosphopyruvate hydratase [Gammaproteobacteria bacterium]
MRIIKNIHARQIIDSRGTPTVEVDCILDNGIVGRAAVPSGASTGEHEALELRDYQNIYFGKSVFEAVKNVNTLIKNALVGQKCQDIYHLDKIMFELDGTANKSALGANAILGVSLSLLKALAKSNNVNIYEYIHKIHSSNSYSMPVPMMNILNGGSHADNNVDIQEFMIYPSGLNSFTEALQCGCEIFNKLKNVLKSKGYNTAVGDEGGFAPNLGSNQEAIDLILESIIQANYKPGEEVFLTLDVASSELYNKKTSKYELKSENLALTSDKMINYYQKLCAQYPIVSIEDGLDENDWEGWATLTSEMQQGIQLVGDDLTVTNIHRLQKAIDNKAINAILIKLNQIGSVSETLEAIKLAQSSNLGVVISHRSGETEDTTIADLSVGTGAGQIKTGSLCRSERVAKYNQLLRIEENLDKPIKFG